MQWIISIGIDIVFWIQDQEFWACEIIAVSCEG